MNPVVFAIYLDAFKCRLVKIRPKPLSGNATYPGVTTPEGTETVDDGWWPAGDKTFTTVLLPRGG